MNEVVKAVRREYSNAQDNLARARAQQRAMPTWVSGNGEPIDEVVRGYELRVYKIRRDAEAVGIDLG